MGRAALTDRSPSFLSLSHTQPIPTTHQILAGDPKQLGPSTRSPLISQLGLAKSLQEHLMDTRAIYDVHKPVASDGARTYIVQLRKNYRSHEVSEKGVVAGNEREKVPLFVLDLTNKPLSTPLPAAGHHGGALHALLRA